MQPAPVVAGPLARLVAFYEHLSLESLAQLGTVYAPDARFKDPFNEVEGHVAILAIFEHMFVQVDAPRFVVLESLGQGEQAFLTWEFSLLHETPGIWRTMYPWRNTCAFRCAGTGGIAPRLLGCGGRIV